MPNSRFEDLTTEECWELLDATRFGRLATCAAGEPDVFPVNFLVHDSSILIRTAPGTKLAEVVVSSLVAIESDAVEDDHAWSVVAKGTGRIVERFSEAYELDEEHLQTWLPDSKPVYVVISVSGLSGRRFYRSLDA